VPQIKRDHALAGAGVFRLLRSSRSAWSPITERPASRLSRRRRKREPAARGRRAQAPARPGCPQLDAAAVRPAGTRRPRSDRPVTKRARRGQWLARHYHRLRQLHWPGLLPAAPTSISPGLA